jgi:hypothetical protein
MSNFVRWIRAAVGAALLLVTLATAAQVPNLINYQGFVAVSGASFTGSGQFRFALVNNTGTTTYWSNDGSSVGGGQPTNFVPLPVSGGVFSVVLGDIGLLNMTAIPPTVFTGNSDVRLRVWFNDGSHGVQQLSPDQRVVAAAYAIAVDPASTTLTSNFFKQGGNAFGATAVLGTTDNNAIDVLVNGSRVMRYEPNAVSPNVLGGHPANNLTAGVRGATIGGGGTPNDPDYGFPFLNRVTDAYGTVGGGAANVAGDDIGTVIDRPFATVGGGFINIASGQFSTVTGGTGNVASGEGSTAGGGGSHAYGNYSTVAGGFINTANGFASTAGGIYSVATGDYSFAAGTQARALHIGTFAWADAANSSVTFDTLANHEFAVRATGGVRFVTAIDGSGNPTRAVKVNGNGEIDFGSQSRQMINLWGPALYGLGIQSGTQYARSDGHFTWFRKGVHSDIQYDPGAGGEVLMSVSSVPGTGSGTTHTGTVRAAAFTVTSDRNAKREFAAVDTAEVLAKVIATPVTTWAYNADPDTRHIGMTGQDFRAAFGVGDSDKSIATVDADGVALAAIQGLNSKLEERLAEKDARIAALESQLGELRRTVELLAARSTPELTVASR